jgi:hypothetical protein
MDIKELICAFIGEQNGKEYDRRDVSLLVLTYQNPDLKELKNEFIFVAGAGFQAI